MSARHPLSDELLTPTEVHRLTDSADPDAQEKVLCQDGIPYRRRGRRILVSRYHLREWLTGRPVAQSRGFDFTRIK